MIAQAIIRLVVRAALRDTTLARGNVFDSRVEEIDTPPSDPIGGDRRGEAVSIVIFTDDAKGRDLREGDFDVELTIEWHVSTLIEDDDNQLVREIALTSAGLEFMLNMVGAQIGAVLRGAGNPWADLFRRLTGLGPLAKPVLRRGATERSGIRRALAQLVTTLTPPHEPVLGVPPTGVWADALDLLEADPQFAHYARALRTLITGDGSIDDTMTEILRGGAPTGRAEAMSLVPLGPTITALHVEAGTLE